MRGMNALRAYNARSADRSFRDQEADIFRRATAALRAAQTSDELDRARALADNRRLWKTVTMLMWDRENALPESLRGAIISVGMAVERESRRPQPDLSFLIAVNENITAGLIGA